MALEQRLALTLLALALLAGCGFQLRSSQALPFDTIAVTPEQGGGVAGEMARYLGARVRPLAPGPAGSGPEVVLDILQESRDKLVVGVNASGQVREFELRLQVGFRLRTPQGEELMAPAVIAQRRSISFSESAVLAKEAEEALLYRDMQSDVVQQLLRRLATAKPAAQQATPPAAPSAPAAVAD